MENINFKRIAIGIWSFVTKNLFFILIVVSFLLSTLFFIIKLYTHNAAQSYRYFEGKNVLLNLQQLAANLEITSLNNLEDSDKLLTIISNTVLTHEERQFARVILYLNTSDNNVFNEKVDFFAKCSVDTALTEDLKSFCVFMIFFRMMLGHYSFEHMSSILQNTPPYPGILQSFSDADSRVLGLLQFCTDTSKFSYCSIYYYFLLSEIYDKDKTDSQNKNIKHKIDAFNFLSDRVRTYLITNWGFLKQTNNVMKIMLVGYNINLLENGIQSDEKYLAESFKSMEQIFPSNEVGSNVKRDINVYAWNEFMYAKYYIYKKQNSEALVHIKNLNQVDSTHTDLYYLLSNTHLLDKDKDKFKELYPDFKY